MYAPSTSSGSLAVGTTVIATKAGMLCNVILNPGSAASSVTIYDNASAASGTVIHSLVAAANTNSVASNLSVPIVFNNGCTVVVAGTAATAIVSFTIGG